MWNGKDEKAEVVDEEEERRDGENGEMVEERQSAANARRIIRQRCRS